MTRNRTRLGVLACAAAWSALASSALSAEKPGFRGIGLLPGGTWSAPASISADGRVVVGIAEINSSGDLGSFRWSAETGIELLEPDRPLPRYDVAFAVSADGQFIAGDIIENDRASPFRWSVDSGFEELGNLPGTNLFTRATDISADGRIVVGYSIVDGEMGFHAGAFRWDAETGMTETPPLASNYPQAQAYGISDDGTIIAGTSSSRANTEVDYDTAEPVIWVSGAEPRGLGFLAPGHTAANATGISGDGRVVVGASVDANQTWAPFRWTEADGMMDLGQLSEPREGMFPQAVSSDGSVIVGFVQAVDQLRAAGFIWTEDRGLRYFTSELSELCMDSFLQEWSYVGVRGISGDGTVLIGFGTDPEGRDQGWVLRLPSLASLACEGDADRDLHVNFADVTAVLANFGRVCRAGAGAPGDSDLNGEVAFADIVRVLEHFGEACE